MKKIASPDELASELTQLLEYVKSPNPSREKLAHQLQALSERVAKSDFKVGDRVYSGRKTSRSNQGTVKEVQMGGRIILVKYDKGGQPVPVPAKTLKHLDEKDDLSK